MTTPPASAIPDHGRRSQGFAALKSALKAWVHGSAVREMVTIGADIVGVALPA
jgi:hypothetical protein